MAKSLSLEMVTPEKIALKSQASFVVLPAYEGEMGILPGHEPFMVELTAGEVRVTDGSDVKHYAIAGGFAEILKDKVSVFAETAEMASEIDAEAARQAMERAKATAARRDVDPMTLAAAEAALRWEQAKLRVAALRGRRKPAPPHRPE